jgi:prepilin-type N-terminal cleavage/methylation domain-containing protein
MRRGKYTAGVQMSIEVPATTKALGDPCARRREAFTLVELLIVVAIVGMLLSLTLPAIRASRESGRKVQCLNNTRQIGLAIHGYHDAKKELPPSRVKDGFLTWAALILPYLGETTSGELVDPSLNFFRQPEVVRRTPVKLFICPSRARRGLLVGEGNGTGIKGDYSAMSSTFLTDAEGGKQFDGSMVYADSEMIDPDTKPQRLKWQSRTALIDITDGLSNTFLVVEASLWSAERVSIYNGMDQPGAILGDANYPKEIKWPGRARGVANDWPLETDVYVGSAHQSVIIVTMCDGSSRPIDKSTDIVVLESLVTRAGNETVNLADADAN